MPPLFPFSQVVGMGDAKLALQLVAIDPLIGGVLLRGQKGSAKTTLARGLAAIVGDHAPFVELPLGVTEDRLIGTLDLARALAGEDQPFSPGLLANVDGGVLYVDEVNLLADHLVDALLDVAVSGVNRIEREGISHEHPSRFALIGSMNPEEGELRPQLLDRFGLSVEAVASDDIADRTTAVRRRLIHDGAAVEGDDVPPAGDGDEGLRDRLRKATPAALPETILEHASALAVAVGAEGLRADLVLCRAAAANAGLNGRPLTTEDDLRRVAPLVLSHRSRRNPFDPATIPADELGAVVDSVLGDEPQNPGAPDNRQPDSSPPQTDRRDNTDGPDPTGASDDGRTTSDTSQGNGGDDRSDGHDEGRAQRLMTLGAPLRPSDLSDPSPAGPTNAPASGNLTGRRTPVESTRGRLIRDVGADSGSERPIAVAATVRHLARRRSADPDAVFDTTDIREAVRADRAGSLLIIAVDTSGSMGGEARARLATGTALGLLADAYEHRDQVAVVAFGGSGARTVLTPTGSIEVAKRKLQELESGGATPLAAGLNEALRVAEGRRDKTRSPMIILLSDGRATGQADGDAMGDAVEAATNLAKRGVTSLVLNCETGTPRLGLAARLAEAMSAPCLDLSDLDLADDNPSTGGTGFDVGRLTAIIRSRVAPTRASSTERLS